MIIKIIVDLEFMPNNEHEKLKIKRQHTNWRCYIHTYVCIILRVQFNFTSLYRFKPNRTEIDNFTYLVDQNQKDKSFFFLVWFDLIYQSRKGYRCRPYNSKALYIHVYQYIDTNN